MDNNTMKSSHLSRTVAALSIGAAALTLASPLLTKDTGWTGDWKDGQGGVLAVIEREGVLEVHGADAASIYRLVCIVDKAKPTLANCVGDGINREKAVFRFTYRSQWQMGADGSFAETWQANYAEGQRSGRAVFRQAGAATR